MKLGRADDVTWCSTLNKKRAFRIDIDENGGGGVNRTRLGIEKVEQNAELGATKH